MSARRHVANSQMTNSDAQVSHAALGCYRVALGLRYDLRHEFLRIRVGWSTWILRDHQNSGTS